MRAHIIIIGDELMNGRISDTNGPWLADFLFKENLTLGQISIVRDDPTQLKAELAKAWNENDLVICTGGLGPTEDDLTKNILSEFFNCPLKENKKATELARDHYLRYGKDWNPQNNGYQFIPEGFTPLANPTGLAPGLMYQKEGKTLFCAPGVPRELKSMMTEIFWPIFSKENIEKKNIQQIVIRTRGIPEEGLFKQEVKDLWAFLSQFGKVSSLPQTMGVDILITFEGSEELRNDHFKQIKEFLKETPIKENIWQWGNQSLEEFIITKASQKNLKISLAESCTGGLAASRLTDISGSSSVFLGSAVTYANQAKENILGVSEQTLKKFGAVSIETAKEMAKGSLLKFNSDIAISWTGIAGPGGGSAEKPVGTVAIGIATKNEVKAKIYQFHGDRKYLKRRFSEKGLFSLLRTIEKIN